jgi:hypothetical protein
MELRAQGRVSSHLTMHEAPDPAVRRHQVTARVGPVRLLAIAATSLLACGDVQATADAAGSAGSDAPANPCAPNACLLSDDFGGTALNTAIWGTSVGGGATVTQSNGILTLRLPAAANAFADVYSLVGFPVGTTFEAKVTFTAGQIFDHKGAGFASARVGADCGVGETDAAMFRGQDSDSYVETKVGGACTFTAHGYPSGAKVMQISRAADQVVFRENTVMVPPVKVNVPTALLPIRFSAYTYTMAPGQPVQIDVDYVHVSRP